MTAQMNTVTKTTTAPPERTVPTLKGASNGDNALHDDAPLVETDLLIVGTGPAGASLACFLTSYGLKGIMIGAAPGSADTPRAHITNMAALECLRDIGLEQQCMSAATEGDCMEHTRWCWSMAGEEFARCYSWGNDPARKGDYDAASPCTHVDLPQTVLEPILVRHAVLNGFSCRFDTSFLSFSRDGPEGPVISTVRDNLTSQAYRIRSKYLFGCDGARSQIIRQLQIPLIKKPGQGLAINCLVKVDLSHVVENRMGNLHWIMQPGKAFPDFGWACIARMVRPWNEWMFIFLPRPGTGVEFTTDKSAYEKRIRECIGDDSIEFELLNTSKWFINELVAERYSDGNVFCLGDAVHRHPPFNGLGSNTCIQDAFNLAWKIAHVMKGHASPKLLDTFSTERQPVGASVVTRANQGLRDHVPIFEALGMMEESIADAGKAFAELGEASEKGRARRIGLAKGVEWTAHEFHAVGQEMNQRYDDSCAIFLDEELAPPPSLPFDPVLNHQISTYPGSRLPHAWLNTRLPGPKFSTIDLAGHGAFCLLTGIGGEVWKAAAQRVGASLAVKVNAYAIGWQRDFEDVYGDWGRRREVAEEGAVLVRPDRFVCWRAKAVVGDEESCVRKLEEVMRRVLGWE